MSSVIALLMGKGIQWVLDMALQARGVWSPHPASLIGSQDLGTPRRGNVGKDLCALAGQKLPSLECLDGKLVCKLN